MKVQKNQTNQKLIAIALVLLMLISIGYAALSTTLTINGTANIGSSSWLVYFTNVVPNANNNVAQVVTEPSTTGKETTTLNWAVNMDTPGQVYEFTVDVVNEGSVDAMIATETENLITQGLSTAQKKYLDYTVTYINGAAVEKNDKLAAGETKTLKVRLEFKTDVAAADLPQDAETISLSYGIKYVQADENAIEKFTMDTSVGLWYNTTKLSDDGEIIDLLKSEGDTYGEAIMKWNIGNSYIISVNYTIFTDSEDDSFTIVVGTPTINNISTTEIITQLYGTLDGDTIELGQYLKKYVESLNFRQVNQVMSNS